MIKTINEVRIRGRIGNVKFFGSNNGIASISVATVESYKDRSGNWQEITTWHNVKAFSARPGMISFSALEKGKWIDVIGKIAKNKYTGKDGNERETTEVEAADIVIIEDIKTDSDRGQRNYGRDDEEEF